MKRLVWGLLALVMAVSVMSSCTYLTKKKVCDNNKVQRRR